eukprot:7718054-Alexandrium_andersonii.AAC.1
MCVRTAEAVLRAEVLLRVEAAEAVLLRAKASEAVRRVSHWRQIQELSIRACDDLGMVRGAIRIDIGRAAR